MSTLIPSITTCKFDSPGERRFARLLEAKLLYVAMTRAAEQLIMTTQ